MNTELKKCARCGAEPTVLVHSSISYGDGEFYKHPEIGYYVKCPNCIEEKTPIFEERWEAMVWWNGIIRLKEKRIVKDEQNQ